jgi:hypothetical protein
MIYNEVPTKIALHGIPSGSCPISRIILRSMKRFECKLIIMIALLPDGVHEKRHEGPKAEQIGPC